MAPTNLQLVRWLLCAFSIFLPYEAEVGLAEIEVRRFPHFLQCDQKWGSDLMGEVNCSVVTCPGAKIGRDTVCRQGEMHSVQ